MGCIINSQMAPTNPTYVRVDNNGGFNVRVILSYITRDGRFITEISQPFSLGGSRRSDYPNDVTDIKLAIEVEVAIGVFSIAYTRELPMPGKNCFNVTGVTAAPVVTEYQCPQFDSYMQVDCDGVFVTRFFMNYLTKTGERVSLSSGGFTAGMRRALYYPPEILQVSIKIQIAVFIETFQDVYNNTFTTPDRRCFSTKGTVFRPSVVHIDCFE